jgi:dynein intermediate chain 1
LIVGDDKGGVNSLKLSPNLCNLYRPSGNDSSVGDTYDDIQRDKMKNLIAILDAKSEYKAKG